MKSGLSANQVYDICTDQQGFLILATDQGLNRYDGREVELIDYPSDPRFGKRRFTNLLKDQREVVWASSGKDLFQIRPGSDITRVVYRSDTTVGAIRELLLLPAHQLLMYTWTGWFVLDIATSALYAHPSLNKLTRNIQLSSLSLTRNHMLVGIANGYHVVKLDINAGELKWRTAIDNANALTILGSGNIAVATEAGYIFVLDDHTGVSETTFESERFMGNTLIHNSITDVLEIEPGVLAYSTEDAGMYILHLGTGRQEKYEQDVNQPHSLASNQCSRLLKDDQGNVFVGFLFNGIDFFNRSRYFIEKKSHFIDEQHRYFKSYTNSIIEGKNGTLWIGAGDRVIEYDRTEGKTKFHFYHEQHPSLTQESNYLLGFKTIALDRFDRVWQGSFIGGIIIYDPGTKKVRKLTKHPHLMGERRIPSSYIWNIRQDKNGMMWVAHNFGFMRIDPVTLEVDTLGNHPVLKSLPRKRSKFSFEDHLGRMWFGTHANGLYLYDSTKDSLQHFGASLGFGQHCFHIAEDPFGRIYVAHEKGFSIVDGNELFHFHTGTGLRNRPVEGFLFDENGLAFIANHSTLAQFDPTTKVFKYFDTYFGFGDASFISNSMLRLRDGSMIWGTEEGYIAFDPKRFDVTSITDHIIIDKISTGSGHVFLSDTIQIQRDDAITFEFTSVDLFGIKNIIYQYQLNGLGEEWIHLGTENQVTFSSLPAKTYQFKVRASTNGVDWTVCGRTPEIRVSVPLLKNPFVLTLLFGTIAILGGLYLYQRQRVRSREAVFSQQMAELEVKAIRAQMNPHFVFNALNSIQYFTYSGDVDKANEYLSDFARLMRLVLQQSRDGWTTVEEEIQLLSLYLKIEALRFNHEFEYKIHVDDNMESPDQVKLPGMILQPLVENAIKHGLIPKKGAKKLDITFRMEEDFLSITIEDNGIGIKSAKQFAMDQKIHIPHTSMGMSLVRKRLNMVTADKERNASLDILETEGINTGTVVTIRIPT